jgi:integrase
MALSNTQIQKAKPKAKSYRLYDERGLYLEVSPAGGKHWRLKYRFGGKEKRLALGSYPDVGLKAAREARDNARAVLANDQDPGQHKQTLKAQKMLIAGDSFEGIARDWHQGRSRVWSESHASNIMGRLERDVFPWLGNRPISEITVPELLKVLRRIEDRGAHETAHRVLGNCGEIFRYAVQSGKAERNIVSDLKGALQPVQKTHLAAITDPKRVGELLRMIDGYQGTLPVKCALRLAPLVFVRPGELRAAEWDAIDLKKAEWRFVVSKTQTEHTVPLATQAIKILEELQPLTGNSRYLFPGQRSEHRPMSNNAVLSAFRRMEISKDEMSGHGFRAMARTILDEELGFRPEIIEHQLAHRVKDPLGRAYNRTSHLGERKTMMQAWADYLDDLKVTGA